MPEKPQQIVAVHKFEKEHREAVEASLAAPPVKVVHRTPEMVLQEAHFFPQQINKPETQLVAIFLTKENYREASRIRESLQQNLRKQKVVLWVLHEIPETTARVLTNQIALWQESTWEIIGRTITNCFENLKQTVTNCLKDPRKATTERRAAFLSSKQGRDLTHMYWLAKDSKDPKQVAIMKAEILRREKASKKRGRQ